MRDQEIIGLWEAYQQVHAQPEEYVDEIAERVADDTGETGRGPRLIDAYNKAPYSDDKDSAKNPIPIKLKRKGPKMKGVVRKEETDLFDYLLEYLVAEGYADTNKAALAIMANMSEEWKQSIVEAFPNVKGNLGGPNPIDPKTGKSKYKMITDPKTGKPTEIENPGFGRLPGV